MTGTADAENTLITVRLPQALNEYCCSVVVLWSRLVEQRRYLRLVT